MQDANDGLCLAGSKFQRCSIDTLWFVEGSPGSYKIHRRPRDEDEKEKCLAKKSCDFTEKAEEVRLSKCSHCGAKKWNVLSDDKAGAKQGYILSFDEGKTCLVREPSTSRAITVDCKSSEYNYTPLQLNFANAKDIEAMDSEGARFVASAAKGDKGLVKRYLKEGVDVNSADWDKLTPLMAAASGGHLDVVKVLLDAGADKDAVDKDGISALMEASMEGKDKVVKHLVEQGVDVNLKSSTGANAVWLAAAEGKTDVLKYLLSKGGDVKVKRSDGISVLAAACIAGHKDVIKLLLKDEAIVKGDFVNETDNEGLTPIINVCEQGSLDILKMLVKSGGDVNAVSNTGFTPLIVASSAGFLDQVKFLIQNGAKVDQLHSEGVTALMYAAASGHLDIVKHLVANKADVSIKHSNGGTALMETGASASKSNAEIMAFLIENGAEHDIIDKDSVTPLMSAASQGQCACVDLILATEKKKSKDKDGLARHVNLVANSGGSALMFAAGSGKVECVQSLLDAGAEIHMKVEATPEYLDQLAQKIASGEESEPHVDGIDSLMIAAAAGHLSVAKLLLEKGADPLMKDDEDKTALAAAVKGNFGDVASLLVQHGSDPNDDFIDAEGKKHNLLMDSLIVGNEEFAKLLIENGANLNYKDEKGVSTLLQASHRGLTDIVKLILDRADSSLALDESNEDGINSLIAASSEGHSDIVRILVSAKANINAADKDFTTSLMASAVRGHSEIVKMLISAGARIDAQNVDGHTALMFSYNGLSQVATLWDRYKSYLEGSSKGEDESNSKIIRDALANHTATVDLLISSGADQTIKDNEGHTAADFEYKTGLSEEVLEKEKDLESRRKKNNKKRNNNNNGKNEL